MGKIRPLWQPDGTSDLPRLSTVYSLVSILMHELRESDAYERRLKRELYVWSRQIAAELDAEGYVEPDDEQDERE